MPHIPSFVTSATRRQTKNDSGQRNVPAITAVLAKRRYGLVGRTRVAHIFASLVLVAGGALSTWYTLMLSNAQPALHELRAASLRQLESEHAGGCVVPNALSSSGKRPTYVFLHLHKTAGNNLKIALFGFARRNNLTLYHTCRPSQGESLLLSWWFRRRKRAGVDYDCDLAQFASMPYGRRNSFDLIVGHQYFGIHTFIPEREVLYFTFLRDPLVRKISHYEHFESTDGSVTSKVSTIEERKLWKYLQQSNRNYMVKRLSTTTPPSEIVALLRSRIFDSSTSAARAALLQSQRNVAAWFFMVGLQERYAESLCVLSKILNSACFYQHGFHGLEGKGLKWARVAKQRTNSRGMVLRVLNAIPPTERAHAISAENLDTDLYGFATTLFERKLADHPECRQLST